MHEADARPQEAAVLSMHHAVLALTHGAALAALLTRTTPHAPPPPPAIPWGREERPHLEFTLHIAVFPDGC